MTPYIAPSAQVYGKAQVGGNAQVYGSAWVGGSAWVCGSAQVYGDARVGGDAQVYGAAQVGGNARVGGSAQVGGKARVGGSAQVSGSALVYGSAVLTRSDHYLCVGPVGSEGRTVTIARAVTPDGRVGEHVVAGCWEGTLDDLAARIEEPDAWLGADDADVARWRDDYRMVIAAGRIRVAQWVAEGWSDEDRALLAVER